MELSFEWDEEKAALNRVKHGVPFDEAAGIFLDPRRIERHDGRETYGEDRFVTIGVTDGIELAVAYTVRADRIRIISARRATRHEQVEYWKGR